MELELLSLTSGLMAEAVHNRFLCSLVRPTGFFIRQGARVCHNFVVIEPEGLTAADFSGDSLTGINSLDRSYVL